MYTLLNENRS